MNLDDAITISKITLENTKCYLMIGWLEDSFEMYLFVKDKLWKGRFSSNRLSGFSRNLHMNEEDYFKSVKQCLSHERDNYRYELKSGFFYWKRKLKEGNYVLEGFLPVEPDLSPKKAQPDLLDTIFAINTQLRDQIDCLKAKYTGLKADFHKCLKDTEEFLSLKVEMEKALSEKFLNLIKVQQAKVNSMDKKPIRFGLVKELLEGHEE